MNDDEREIFEAWLQECEEIQDLIFNKRNSRLHTASAVFDHAIRPYHYFKQDWLASHGGKGGNAGNSSAEGMSGPKVKGASSGELASSAPTSAEGRESGGTGLSAPEPGGSVVVRAGDAAAKPSAWPIKVHISGDTKPHKDVLKNDWKLRWSPSEKHWWGTIPFDQEREFLSAMKAMKLEVRSE